MSGNRAFTVCILALGILFAFQINLRNELIERFSKLNTSLHSIDTRLSKLHQYIKTFEEKEDAAKKPTAVVQDGIYDIKGHEPHSRYLKNIEVNPEDPNRPLDPNREYTYDDFVKIFEVEPLHKVVVAPNVVDLIKGHNYKDDYYYDQWKKEIKDLKKKYSSYLAEDSLEQRDREYMVINADKVHQVGFTTSRIRCLCQKGY